MRNEINFFPRAIAVERDLLLLLSLDIQIVRSYGNQLDS